MAFESLSKIAPALFSPEQDLIEVFNKKTGTIGVINPSYIGGNTPPSGVSGAIQFSNGSAFSSDATNLFWDDTNNRLGIGTNAPTAPLDVNGDIKTNNNIYIQGNAKFIYANTGGGSVTTGLYFRPVDSLLDVYINGQAAATFGASTRALIKGSGSTSATTSLLVQNSAGASTLSVKDDGYVTAHVGLFSLGALTGVNVAASNILYNAKFWNQSDGGTTIGAQAAPAASAILDIRSTTSGVLFPRMTTTQINNIASPAEGLIAYNTTISHLCCYQAGAWVKFSHSPM